MSANSETIKLEILRRLKALPLSQQTKSLVVKLAHGRAFAEVCMGLTENEQTLANNLWDKYKSQVSDILNEGWAKEIPWLTEAVFMTLDVKMKKLRPTDDQGKVLFWKLAGALKRIVMNEINPAINRVFKELPNGMPASGTNFIDVIEDILDEICRAKHEAPSTNDGGLGGSSAKKAASTSPYDDDDDDNNAAAAEQPHNTRGKGKGKAKAKQQAEPQTATAADEQVAAAASLEQDGGQSAASPTLGAAIVAAAKTRPAGWIPAELFLMVMNGVLSQEPNVVFAPPTPVDNQGGAKFPSREAVREAAAAAKAGRAAGAPLKDAKSTQLEAFNRKTAVAEARLLQGAYEDEIHVREVHMAELVTAIKMLKEDIAEPDSDDDQAEMKERLKALKKRRNDLMDKPMPVPPPKYTRTGVMMGPPPLSSSAASYSSLSSASFSSSTLKKKTDFLSSFRALLFA